jgi:hypothetical protein
MIKPLLKAATFDRRPGLNALVVLIAISVSVTFGYFGYQYLTANAAGSRMYLAPAKAQVAAGGSLVVEVRADSFGSAVNAAQVNVTYPANKLQYEGYDAQGGPFEVHAATNDEPGVIRIARGTTTPVTGDFKILSLRFTALGAGKASVRVDGSSALVRSSDATDVLASYGVGNYNIKRSR